MLQMQTSQRSEVWGTASHVQGLGWGGQDLPAPRLGGQTPEVPWLSHPWGLEPTCPACQQSAPKSAASSFDTDGPRGGLENDPEMLTGVLCSVLFWKLSHSPCPVSCPTWHEGSGLAPAPALGRRHLSLLCWEHGQCPAHTGTASVQPEHLLCVPGAKQQRLNRCLGKDWY